jgi:hypothetical protein
VAFTFLQKHQSMGFHKVHNLLAYLRFTSPPSYREAIDESFMDSAFADAADVTWDPTTHSVLTSVDTIFSNIDEGQEDDDFGYNKEMEKVIVDAAAMQVDNESTTSPSPRTRNLDDDSITTFRSAYKKTRFAESTKPPAQASAPVSRPPRSSTRSTRAPDDVSTHSEITTDSRLSALESQSATIMEQSNARDTQIAHILTIVQRLEQNTMASAQSQENSGAGCPP